MALDEALLEAVACKQSPPTLRLYAWDPPCLSLGYAQSKNEVNHQALTEYGWDLVRRPTGGRAILHTDEITYSITVPGDDLHVAGKVIETYQRFSRALLLTLKILGVPATAEKEYQIPVDLIPNGPVCFETPSHYEITVSGKKLIGSAQSRRYGGVLQHGSLPLYGDLTRITLGLEFKSEAECEQAARRLSNRATTVENVLGLRVTWAEAAEAFKQGFEKALNLELTQAEPTQAELTRAGKLINEKYNFPGWTDRL